MNVPVYIILFSFVISILLVVGLKVCCVPAPRARSIMLISFTIIWAFITFFGECVYFWAGNATCSKYLGCVAGFAGFDAFEHLFFGVAAAIALFWLSDRFPKYSVLHSETWKNVLTVIAIIALLSVLWEIAECAYDAIRVGFFHEVLFNASLHINLLSQASNLDTMGDLTFAVVGSVIGVFLEYVCL